MEAKNRYILKRMNWSIVVPAIHCLNESCDGIYVKCNGLIEKLSGEELDKERSAAWEGENPWRAAYRF